MANLRFEVAHADRRFCRVLSERTWNSDAVVRLLLGIFVMFCVGQLVWISVKPLVDTLTPANGKLIRLAVTTFFTQGAMAAMVLMFVRQQNLTWSDAFGFNMTPKSRALALGLIAGLVFVPIAWLFQHASIRLLELLNITPEAQQLVREFQEASRDKTSAMANFRHQLFFAISVIVIAPVAEELLFRGILYPTFKKLGYPMLGLLGTSALFAVLHMNIISMLPFFILGLLLVSIYELTDNLLAPIAMHSVFNALNFSYMIYDTMKVS